MKKQQRSAEAQAEPKKPAPNPLCGECNHPRTMHGRPPGRCKAIGCSCSQFV